jgi:aminoglycoside phosphotransferase (APT) family kinase protein
VHNDYQIENILVDAADPATAVAVLDWDMCTRGDPLMDLGYLLNCWSDPDDDPSWRGVSPTPGRARGLPTRREVVERYARSAGFDVEHARWYHVFGVFKLAVVLEQIHVRFRRGQTRDARFATLGERVERLAAKGLALL